MGGVLCFYNIEIPPIYNSINGREEREAGVEPAISGFQTQHSTIEPLP